MIQRLRELIGAVSFHRGLALGALVGSAIAGSTVWAKVRSGREASRTIRHDSRADASPPRSATTID